MYKLWCYISISIYWYLYVDINPLKTKNNDIFKATSYRTNKNKGNIKILVCTDRLKMPLSAIWNRKQESISATSAKRVPFLAAGHKLGLLRIVATGIMVIQLFWPQAIICIRNNMLHSEQHPENNNKVKEDGIGLGVICQASEVIPAAIFFIDCTL